MPAMSFVAAASREVRADRAACFARFVDFPSWRVWMPPSFRPLKGPAGALAVGDSLRFRIRAGVLPVIAAARVVRLEPGREITWRGGVPGVLVGEHSFHFEDAGSGTTRVRSEETWSGAIASWGFVGRRILPMAEKIAGEQLDGFAADVEKR